MAELVAMVSSIRRVLVLLVSLCLWIGCGGVWTPFLEYRNKMDGSAGNLGDAGQSRNCKDVTSFLSNVVPAMQSCMIDCHGGANPQAKGTMDLSMLNEATPVAACIEVRARIVPGNPDASSIVQVTSPLSATKHSYKFAGNIAAYNDFKSKVSQWISAEQ